MRLHAHATIALMAILATVAAAEPVAVHEWGTFTALHDEDGRAIGGINTDDEPLPPFVHDVSRLLLITPTELPPMFFQGAPSCHRDVTMRLETPVLYFHPPSAAPCVADVRVAFAGGWLTQYYPDAVCTAPGLDPDADTAFGPLRADTRGSLAWTGLAVGGDAPGPETRAHVWLAPRQVQAAAVTTAAGEHEKYLFYRGVGHLDAPLSVVRVAADRVRLASRLDPADQPLPITRLWLVDIRADGKAAQRTLPGLTIGADRSDHGTTLTEVGTAFAPGDYGDGQPLRREMRAALIADGLAADEAQALLDTWELSYFKSAGLRLFFLLPQAWTDRVLPLTVALSGGASARITRTMVGRIELVSPEQRRLLQVIADGPTSDPKWLQGFLYGEGKPDPGDSAWAARFQERWRVANAETGGLAKAGAPIPADYRAYLALGRFRNALLLDEAQRRPSANLARFIGNYRLEAYSPRE
jgi:hypothetical protein